MYLKLTGILLAIFCLKAFSNEKIVYGEDNRQDFYATSNNLHRELALSTAAMIDKSKLLEKNDSFQIAGLSLRSRGVCAEERFSDQITAANCSGFLVGQDLLVTAGHCIEDKADCEKYSWVFDYHLKYEDDKANAVSKNAVYNCKKIVERKLSTFFGKNDYALIQLDRKSDRRPLEYRRRGKVDPDTKLVVIGHPTGLPTKIADGAKVRKSHRTYFTADLDTFGGNSGSAVFDDQGVVQGILVRGDVDYINRNGCRSVNQVSQDGGRGEEVTHITNIKALR